MPNTVAEKTAMVWTVVTKRVAVLVEMGVVCAVSGVAADVFIPVIHAFLPLQTVLDVTSARM